MGCFHDELSPGDIHRLQQYEYADATARTTASGFVAADEGKVARQLDDDSFWILIDATVPTWAPLTASALVPAATVTDETTLGIATAVGTSADYAREDHTHGSPPAATIAAASGTVVRPYAVGVSVRDVVYIRPDGVADRASATAVSTGIAVGFAETLDTPSIGFAVIRFSGDLGGFSGLVPGSLYLLGQSVGSIVEETDTGNIDYPDVTPQSGHVVHEVGISVSTTTLFVGVTRDFIEI